MKKQKQDASFKVGDRVAEAFEENDDGETVSIQYDEYADNLWYGTITDVLSTGKVLIKWDETSRVSDEHIDPATLISEAEMKKRWTLLEKEFNKAEAAISLKLKEAGKLILQANKMAQKAGRNLSEMYEVTDELTNAMDECGWRTSSLGC